MPEAQCSLTVPGQLILSFSKKDEAARQLIENLREGPVDNISHVQSLEEKLREVHSDTTTDFELEFHLVEVPEGEEHWAVSHLQFLYRLKLQWRARDRTLSPQFLEQLGLPEYGFVVVPNGVLALPGGGGGASGVRAVDFRWGSAHDTYKSMMNIRHSPANVGQVTIAVVDSGIADDVLSDPVLWPQYNISRTGNFVNPKVSEAATDEYGHGTVVSQIINDVVPGVQLIVYKVVDASGRATEWDTLAAVAACGDADVVNMSLQFGLKDRTCGGCGHQSRSSRSAVFSNMIGQVSSGAVGPVFVASAGNAAPRYSPDSELAFPSRFANVLAIGAINSRWELSSFSYFGNKNHEGNTHENHYVLPGGEASGTSVESVGSFGSDKRQWYGTSFAAAYASAVVASWMARNGAYGVAKPPGILQALRMHADKSNLASYDVGRFGNGVLQA